MGGREQGGGEAEEDLPFTARIDEKSLSHRKRQEL